MFLAGCCRKLRPYRSGIARWPGVLSRPASQGDTGDSRAALDKMLAANGPGGVTPLSDRVEEIRQVRL